MKVGIGKGKEKVMLDKKTYEDIMNYLIKIECKRIERDKGGQKRGIGSALKKGSGMPGGRLKLK